MFRWISTPMSTSGPTASLTAATLATDSRISRAWLSLEKSGGVGVIFTAVCPSATAAAVDRAAFSTVSAGHRAQSLILSRCRPPSRP